MSRKSYDHRLKKVFFDTKNPYLFPNLDIPKSTIMHWIRYGVSDVVTCTELDLNHSELLSKYENAKAELDQLKSLSKLQSFTFKVFGLQIQFHRLPNADCKKMILEAIKSSAKTIALAICLEAIGLSKQRYSAWVKREKKCKLQDQNSYPRLSPQQLTYLEVAKMRDFVTNKRFVHFSIQALSDFAKKTGDLYASGSTWGRMIKDRKWRRPRIRLYPAKPKIGVRASKVNEIWHVDVSVIKLVDGTRCYIQAVIDNFSRYILASDVSLSYGGIKTRILLTDALARARELGYVNSSCVISDGGGENDNSEVRKLINKNEVCHIFAKLQVDFSNSVIEAFFRSLKHNYLYLQDLTTLPQLISHTQIYIDGHNKLIPHSALGGATPIEVCTGLWTKPKSERFANKAKHARIERSEFNRNLQCKSCKS